MAKCERFGVDDSQDKIFISNGLPTIAFNIEAFVLNIFLLFI